MILYHTGRIDYRSSVGYPTVRSYNCRVDAATRWGGGYYRFNYQFYDEILNILSIVRTHTPNTTIFHKNSTTTRFVSPKNFHLPTTWSASLANATYLINKSGHIFDFRSNRRKFPLDLVIFLLFAKICVRVCERIKMLLFLFFRNRYFSIEVSSRFCNVKVRRRNEAEEGESTDIFVLRMVWFKGGYWRNRRVLWIVKSILRIVNKVLRQYDTCAFIKIEIFLFFPIYDST